MKKVLFIVLALLLSGAAWGQLVDAQTLMRRAESGDAKAQYKLGLNYQYGYWGFPKDEAKGIEWWKKAVRNGNGEACYRLGDYYYDKKDYSEAEKWLDQLWQMAEDGNASAQYELGIVYRIGSLGVAKDEAKYMYWLKKSVDQFYPEAECELAEAYIYERCGVSRDTAQMRALYMRAVEHNGGANAFSKLGSFYEIWAKNNTEARKWYAKAAETGEWDGIRNMAYFLQDIGERQEAIYWYKQCQDYYYAKCGKISAGFAGKLRALGVTYNPATNLENNKYMQYRLNPDQNPLATKPVMANAPKSNTPSQTSGTSGSSSNDAYDQLTQQYKFAIITSSGVNVRKSPNASAPLLMINIDTLDYVEAGPILRDIEFYSDDHSVDEVGGRRKNYHPKANEVYLVLEETDGWIKLRLGNNTWVGDYDGWVSKKYAKIVKPERMTLNRLNEIYGNRFITDGQCKNVGLVFYKTLFEIDYYYILEYNGGICEGNNITIDYESNSSQCTSTTMSTKSYQYVGILWSSLVLRTPRNIDIKKTGLRQFPENEQSFIYNYIEKGRKQDNGERETFLYFPKPNAAGAKTVKDRYVIVTLSELLKN